VSSRCWCTLSPLHSRRKAKSLPLGLRRYAINSAYQYSSPHWGVTLTLNSGSQCHSVTRMWAGGTEAGGSRAQSSASTHWISSSAGLRARTPPEGGGAPF